jgi:N-acetylglucosaminyl-diphospho-decaprenol L-rhamnosyltransferase
MTADVIVVTWRSGPRVLGCLERLERQDARHRTIVVDNASGDGTADAVRRSFPSVEVVELPANAGFGAAVNAGAARGSGEALVLVNDDVELEPGSLAALLAPLEADERVGMVAGLTTIPGTDLADAFGIEVDATLAVYNRLRRRPLDEAPGTLLGPSGGLAAYRRTAFEQAGGFDERLFAYGEDVDLALRLRLAGWSAAGAREARGEHAGGASVGVDSPRQRWLAGFARFFLLRRYAILRTRHAPRALAIEALVIAAGMVRGRTLAHVRGRIAGWRAGRGPRLPVPAGAVDRRIGTREALHRLRHAR